MKKFITALLTITMLASLAGCTENSENDTNSPDISNSSDSGTGTVSDNNSEPAQSAPEKDKGEPTFLTGLNGEPIYSGEITEFQDINRDKITVENITPDGFEYAVCEGFCYLAEPSGIARNERDDPGSWNGPMNCVDIPQEDLIPEYKRMYVGDTFCGLTIKKASTEFLGGEFYRCCVEFDGELTLTGYIQINQDNQYSVAVGDLQFLVDSKSAVLPGCPDMNKCKSYGDNVSEPYTVFSYNGFYIENGTPDPDWYWSVSEYDEIYLGNVDTCAADISDIGSDQDCHYKVKVKINNLKIGEYRELTNGDYRYYADIVELEAID